jgi:hypothetical protein
MEHWPVSWGGVAEDKPFGAGLVAELRPFVTHLQILALRQIVEGRFPRSLNGISRSDCERALEKESLRELVERWPHGLDLGTIAEVGFRRNDKTMGADSWASARRF